ncbi:dTDP-4-dehydrorhamnose reductase [Winogradskyella eckloniae]|uniref:dTDP-4-dehydrorhamnose reductase n=1 Tax=Winogradskyella eckloniae TaxID=1089306 RepID=UPI001564B89A|nr:dTDP-4-dehydrorhamnose reductase [Winogradskyella eckloniae]NRD18533.1 dTDP-4-dehydrorhamnose reductase [Winogradskyella eckloniae]
MLTVLVTGKTGQLAQCVKHISQQYPSLQFSFKSSSELDITNDESLEAAFSSKQFDYCINCAAYTNVDKAESESALAHKINVLGAKNLAIACQKHNVTLIHVSTDFVFDGTASVPYSEDASTNPLGIYGKTKLEGETEISKILNNHFIIRTSWLYSEFGNNFLKTMLKFGKEREEINVVSDQIGSPTYAVDLAHVILCLIEGKSKCYGLYHFSNNGAISWYEFAGEIFKLSNSPIILNKIESKDYPTKAVRPKYSVLDSFKIKERLDIEIPCWKTSLETAITNLNRNINYS